MTNVPMIRWPLLNGLSFRTLIIRALTRKKGPVKEVWEADHKLRKPEIILEKEEKAGTRIGASQVGWFRSFTSL